MQEAQRGPNQPPQFPYFMLGNNPQLRQRLLTPRPPPPSPYVRGCRYSRAAEERRGQVDELSKKLQDETGRAEEAALRGEELRSSVDKR